MRGSLVVIPMVLAVVAVGALGRTAEPGPAQTLMGAWGGEGIRVDGAATGASIQVDCLLARTDKVIPLDETGGFAVAVTFVSLPGAQIEGDEGRPPSRVTGRVENDVLHLTIASGDSGADRMFKLQRNVKAKLPNCRLRS